MLRAADGAYVRTIGSKGKRPGQFKDPRGVCVSSDGEHLFVVSYGDDRVQMLRVSDGAHVRTFGSPGRGVGQLGAPQGMCLSSDGELVFVVDSNNHRVQVFRAADGKHVRSIGAQGCDADDFFAPTDVDVCVSNGGEWLFVADTLNQRVQVLGASDGERVCSNRVGSAKNNPSLPNACVCRQTANFCLSVTPIGIVCTFSPPDARGRACTEQVSIYYCFVYLH